TKLIDRNTTIPVRKTEVFSTAEHNQTTAPIHVLQGERPMARDNKSLGRFNLEGIPPMPAGMPQIEVTYDIDANGILHVTAREKSTGKEASITIQNTTTLGEDEVERMVKEAEQHADEDRRLRELAEAKNQLDGLRLQAEKAIQDASGASDDQKRPLQEAVDDAKRLIDGDPTKDELEQKTRELAERLQAFMQATAQQPAQQADQGQQQGGQGDDEEVIDADFKPAG